MAKKAKKAVAKKASKTASAKKTKSASPAAEKKTKKVAKKVGAKKASSKPAGMIELSENEKRWLELQQKFGSLDAPVYNMSGVFNAKSPLKHKVLGWGYILNNENDRLEVIFQEGVKMLISNYKKSS